MKKFCLFIFNLCSLLWLESIFHLIIFSSFSPISFLSIFLYLIPISLFNTLLVSIFNKNANFILGILIYTVLGIWFSLHLVFKNIFKVFFQVSLFSLSDQVTSFGKETIILILSNIHFIILLFLPLILFIIFKNKFDLTKQDKSYYIITILLFSISTVLFVSYSTIIMKNKTPYNVIYKTNDIAKSTNNLGVLHASFLDIYKNITNFEEEIILFKEDDEESSVPPEEIISYSENIESIDFSKGNNSIINNYMLNDTPTYQNEYTGIFKNKNLIYIVAESFHTIGVSEELTPTLYKLINSGFLFKNFYVPNNLSTIGGEFQALTGLYADNSILKTWRNGKNYFPYGLATKFKNEGYNTYAYHNNSYLFQDRNKYLKSQGFTNFKACYNGLEKLINCKSWPQSDIQLFNKTIPDYINSNNPFMAYYVTVSGHFQYNFTDNYIAYKNRKLVKHLKYSEEAKAYVATQIELDRALETLIKELEKKEILDDTVIVLLADHYPYALDNKKINELSTYKRDSIELHHNNLIIWNNQINQKEIDKVCMSLDVLPTIYNLFGINYDSRLIIGKDIFSNTEGMAILKDRSWVTDKGSYYSTKNSFIPTTDNIDDDYVEKINQIVSNKLNISKLILSKDYYRALFK